MTNSDPGTDGAQANSGPDPAAVSFVTTEHFTLPGAPARPPWPRPQAARSRSSAPSPGALVALGLIATPTGVEEELHAFGLILLPTLALAA